MNRKMRYYLRGMGLGIFLTTLILSLVGIRQKNMTDEEIMAKARELGMVNASELSLTSIGNTSTGIGTIVTPEEMEAEESASEEEEETEETPQTEGPEESSEPLDDAEKPEAAGDMETAVDTENAEAVEAAETPENAESVETTEDLETTETTENTETGPAEEATEAVSPEEESPAQTEEKEQEQPVTEESEAEVTPEPEEDAQEATESPAETGQMVTITVSRGSGSETVARNCAKAGLVESASAFDKYLIDNGYSKSIRVGTFEIPMGSDMQTIAKILTSKN